MGSVSFVNVVASIWLSGRVKVGEIIRFAIAGKFNDARIKLLELTNVYGMSERDFLKYANQELYEMKLDHLDELAALMAEYDYRLAVGAHPEIQLSALLAQLGKLGSKGK
jgi:replication factor C small subunit